MTLNTQLVRKVQDVMLAKRHQVFHDVNHSDPTLLSTIGNNSRLALTLQANLESYGYGFSIDMLKALSHYTEEQLVEFNAWFIPSLRSSLGANHQYKPMYPNFPQQVFEATQSELILNAIMHYTGDMLGVRIMPEYIKKERFPLNKQPQQVPFDFINHTTEDDCLKVIGIASQEDVKKLFMSLMNSNTSLSDFDKECLETLFSYFHHNGQVEHLLKESNISQKETIAFIGAIVLNHSLSIELIRPLFSTATDVLRLAAAFSDADLSLSINPKFVNIKRPMRKALLSLLETITQQGNKELILENMFQKRNVWVRLGEKLHSGEYSNAYPLAHELFMQIRNEIKPTNFNGKVDIAFSHQQFEQLIDLLKQRPGVFARSLNRLFQRIEGNAPQKISNAVVDKNVVFSNMFTNTVAKTGETQLSQLKENIIKKEEKAISGMVDGLEAPLDNNTKNYLVGKAINAFKEVASDVSTPVLLQVYNHFKHQATQQHRVFLPKGAVSKSYVVDNNIKSLSTTICADIVHICRQTLIQRFSSLPSLGNVYLGEELKQQNVPFAMRSASKALKTVARGSSIDLHNDNTQTTDTTRFFIWWQEPEGDRVDLDLSVMFLNKDFNYVEHCSFTQLRGAGYAHSGDITSAPHGACEFIDINRKELNPAIQYIVMVVNSFTSQPYYELPECFAGWMERDKPQTGEIYEPRTVKNKFDLTSDTQTVIPMAIDIINNKAIWMDVSINNTGWYMVENQNASISHAVKSMVHLSKPNLYDLFEMHVAGRGKLVTKKEDADTIFSLHEGITPYEYETIAADFMKD